LALLSALRHLIENTYPTAANGPDESQSYQYSRSHVQKYAQNREIVGPDPYLATAALAQSALQPDVHALLYWYGAEAQERQK
jgi:hypothetical protein